MCGVLYSFASVEKTRPRYFFPQVTDSEQTKPPAPYLQAGVRAAIRSTKPTHRALRRPPGPCLTTAARAGTSNFPLNKSGPRARRSRAATAEAHLAPPRRNHECCVYLVCGHNIIAPSFSPSFVGVASMAWWRSRPEIMLVPASRPRTSSPLHSQTGFGLAPSHRSVLGAASLDQQTRRAAPGR